MLSLDKHPYIRENMENRSEGWRMIVGEEERVGMERSFEEGGEGMAWPVREIEGQLTDC